MATVLPNFAVRNDSHSFTGHLAFRSAGQIVAILAVAVMATTSQARAQTGLPLNSQPPASVGQIGDPYQQSSSQNPTAFSGPAGFLIGSPAVPVHVSGHMDPYATIQSGPSSMMAPGTVPIIEPTVFSGIPVIEGMGSGGPMFPRIRRRIDSRLFLRTEYLRWRLTGMNSPALVTTSSDASIDSGALDQTGTSVVYGGQKLSDGSVNGFLISGGFWTSPAKNIAIESEYFGTATAKGRFNASSDGSVILARPYFDVVDGEQASQAVAVPGIVNGAISVASDSDLRSFLIDGRFSICPTHGPSCQTCGQHDRTDWIMGFRSIRLSDSLTINSERTSQLTAIPGSIAVNEQFDTKNQFSAFQLGVIRRIVLERAWLESSLRMAFGNNKQRLQISGNTSADNQQVLDEFGGQLLALRSNSGSLERDEFMVVPEFGIRLGGRLSERFHLSIGYTLLYLPNVIRASEQIDTDINPGLIPTEDDPLTGAARPRVVWIQSDYLAHGLNFGGELHF